MMQVQQYDGLLIRHRFDGQALVLILEDFTEGFPPDLSETVTEITIEGVRVEELDQESLTKSNGDHVWLTVKETSVVIGGQFMPDREVSALNVVLNTRAYDITDLHALYSLLKSALIRYQESYGLEYRRRSNLQAGISAFITARRDRLLAKREFLKERNPMKAATFDGMLRVLSEMEEELK